MDGSEKMGNLSSTPLCECLGLNNMTNDADVSGIAGMLNFSYSSF
jgi:hypothetical protein